MTFTSDDPLQFLSGSEVKFDVGPHTDLIRQLLCEIIRVKGLINYYDSIPNGGGRLGSSILHELVTEAYNSLINYDTGLMGKYIDLLLHCD